MLTLIISLLFLALFLFKFATADGDFTLLSKGPVKREAVQGKVVWITGASRGIGEILAKRFASLGAKLILSARNVVELERVKNELVVVDATRREKSGSNPEEQQFTSVVKSTQDVVLSWMHEPQVDRFIWKEVIEVLPLDLASGEESLKEAVHIAESLFDGAGVDYMIHNAAFERPKSKALEESEEGLETTFRINVFGTISLTRLLAPFMLRRGRGHFVVMSSAAGKCPAPGQAMYSASKHALNGYFHTLRSELCQKGIKVTVVCPGPIETPTSIANSSTQIGSSEKRVSSERCVELIIIAATHGLKEVWISYQPVLLVMYLVQYMPTIGYWLTDKVGANRLDAAEKKRNSYSWKLFLGQKKKPE